MSDLLLQLLEIWIDRNEPPDVLSLEYPADSMVIRFEWFGGEVREYGYIKSSWDAVWFRFNGFWQNRHVFGGHVK